MALRLGFVGTGKIAGKHAVAASMTDQVVLQAVASRKLSTAEAFTAKHGGEPVEGVTALIAREDIDAIYIATPTAAKHGIAVEALAAGKHVIIEKPFESAKSAYWLEAMAHRLGLVLWDATHFTHNPRTHRLWEDIDAGVIGRPLSLVTSFHADVGTKDNIRFNWALEPQGVLGDLGWYCVRLVSELIPEAFETTSDTRAVGTWDQDALVGISAVVDFLQDGFRLVMDSSFTAGAGVQEMRLIGTKGVISMDDFVHDWEKGRIGDEKPEFPSGYRLNKGRTDPSTAQFIAAPAEKSHMIQLLENFADTVAGRPAGPALAGGRTMLKTQEFLDDIWASLTFKPEARRR